jgi:ammonium transporter Rh
MHACSPAALAYCCTLCCLLSQNATLAGGVAMGSSAALRLSPGGAVAVGLFAGCLSTFGFGWLAGVLEQKLNLGDTCGVHVSSGR